MKSIIVGIIVGILIATRVGAYEANEHNTASMSRMMDGMKGMMGERKSGDQSHEMMNGMKEMMARMSKMMDMCSKMMGNASQPNKDESTK